MSSCFAGTMLLVFVLSCGLIGPIFGRDRDAGKYVLLADLVYPEAFKRPLKHCECGRSNNIFRPNSLGRIINGTNVAFHQYPWLALILYEDTFICGGSIISDSYILTAAHCQPKNFIKDNMKVKLGEFDRCNVSSDTVVLSVSEVIRHSQFNPVTYAWDIMLLKVNMKITFNRFIKPICLPPYDIYQRFVVTKYVGRVGAIVGWGSTVPNNESSITCIPKQANVPVLDRNSCQGNADSLFCAGYLNGEADACQGDSGGPLQIRNKRNVYEIIGIVSSGEGCAVVGKPGLYTDVLQNLNWIYRRISDSTCWNIPL